MDSMSRDPALHRRRRCCNSQIFCAYVLALISTTLVVGGVYLSLLHWDRIWLIFTVIGCILVFIGSCMYYCGTQALTKYASDSDIDDDGYARRRRRKRSRFRDRGLSGDELVPSAPQPGDSRSVSQLSLNMIPQYFSRGADAGGLPSAPPASSMAYSQIFNVNGQSFLILPLSSDAATATLTRPDPSLLSGLVVKLPTQTDQPEMRLE